MIKINDGGFAFPCAEPILAGGDVVAAIVQPGMSMRQWYAGQAMAGLIAQPDGRVCRGEPDEAERQRKEWAINDAAYCFRMADAMIAHEAKEREGGT